MASADSPPVISDLRSSASANPATAPGDSGPASPSTPRGRGRGGRGRGSGRGSERGSGRGSERGSGRGGRGRGKPRGGPRVVRAEDLEDGDERLIEPDDGTTQETPKEEKPVAAAEETITPEQDPPTADVDEKEDIDKGKEKEKRAARKAMEPYINPDRINTGGLKNEKLSPEELDRVMERMRINNEKIMARRELVEADEDTFKSQLDADTERRKAERHARQARFAAEKQARTVKSEADQKVQDQVDAMRAEAVKRKLAKQGGREWDAEKKDDNWVPRGNPGRGRGRGRGRGGPPRNQNEGSSSASAGPSVPTTADFPALDAAPNDLNP